MAGELSLSQCWNKMLSGSGFILTPLTESVSNSSKHIQVTTIPHGETSLVQPLDVYFFRQWKKFAKRFCELVLLDKIDIELHSRNAIINFYALIYNQLSATTFNNRIKHAWKKPQVPVECDAFDAPDNVIWKTEDYSCSTLNCKLRPLYNTHIVVYICV